MDKNIAVFNLLSYETQNFLTLVFNFIDFIKNSKVTITKQDGTKISYYLSNNDSMLNLSILLSVLYTKNDFKNFFNSEGITISNILKQFNKNIKDFELKSDIKQTTSFNEYNLEEIIDEIMQNEDSLYFINNGASIEDEDFESKNKITSEIKIFQFLNYIISNPQSNNYIEIILEKLYKLDDYNTEIIIPKLIDLIDYEAKDYYSFNYDTDVDTSIINNTITYEYDNLSLTQCKNKCFIRLKKQITINGIKLPKYLKIESIEVNNRVYTDFLMIKTLLFNVTYNKIKFRCSNDIEFSINKEILFGNSKEDEHVLAEDFICYLSKVSKEIFEIDKRQEVTDILSKIYNLNENDLYNTSDNTTNIDTKDETYMQKEQSNLEKYGENLTNMFYLKDPSIGRDDIIRKIERILLYPERDKSIIITGPAGTGKTAVVKGLAYRIQKGIVPQALNDIKIISIDAPSIVSGCKYVGTLEEKLKGILDEASTDKNIIIFIDEVHQVMGAGRSEGNKVTIAEILKPYLDYGKVRIIGATTDEEYLENIESNTAFKSRLKRIKLEEPERDVIYEIINDLINAYNKISYSKVIMDEDERDKIINFLIDATTTKSRTFNDRVNNPRLVLDIVKEAYAIAALSDRFEVTIDDFIEALNDEERIYDSSKQRCIQMLKQKTNYKKEKAIILEFKPKK
mgnify:FL=1